MKKMRMLVSALLVCGLLVGLMPQQAEAAESADYKIVRNDHSWYDGSGQLKFLQYVDGIVLQDDTAAARKINASINSIVAKLSEGADENITMAQNNPPRYPGDYYRNYYDATVTKNIDGVLSIKWVGNWYLGGVSNDLYEGVTYDLHTGDKLNVSQLFSTSPATTERYIKNKLIAYVNAHPDWPWWSDVKSVYQIINDYPMQDFKFYVDGKDVVMMFDEYELGPGILGGVMVRIPIVNNAIKVTIDGAPLSFDQPPIVDNNRVMVPIRSIFEALGYTVQWDQARQTGLAISDTNKIRVQLNHNLITFDGGYYWCDVPPKAVSGRILVPIRAIGESANCQVYWNQSKQTVEISTH